MKPADIQSFLPQKPQRLRTVEEPKRQQLVQATYDVVGCLHDVYRQLGPGLPEYIYQEALLTRRDPQRKPNAVFAMGRAGSSEYSLPKRNFGTCIEDRSREAICEPRSTR